MLPGDQPLKFIVGDGKKREHLQDVGLPQARGIPGHVDASYVLINLSKTYYEVLRMKIQKKT